jgi:hypothetical protein
MSQNTLTLLAIISIEIKLATIEDYISLIGEFTNKKNRKKHLNKIFQYKLIINLFCS